MKDILKLCVSLGLVCAIGCALLVCVDDVTQEPRWKIKQEILNDNLQMVLPYGSQATFDERMTVEYGGVVFHRACNGCAVTAVVAETSGKGFGGVIKALVGFDVATDKIIRVMVTEHTETPGLGSQATDRKERKSLWHGSESKAGQVAANDFLDKSFGGKPIGKFEFDKPGEAEPMNIEAVSGATFSSRGVRKAVNLACKLYNEHREELKELKGLYFECIYPAKRQPRPIPAISEEHLKQQAE